jgi:protein tyrosine/serine phosphatase
VKPTLLESILLDLIIMRYDIRILFNEMGEMFLFNNERPYNNDADLQKLKVFLGKSYLNVSLFDIIKDLIKFLGEDECSASHNILSKDEAEVLKHLRGGDASSIEIIFDEEKKDIETIKVTKKSSVTNFSRIQDLILRNGYQDITIKTQNGIVAHCESTTKYKLDTE